MMRAVRHHHHGATSQRMSLVTVATYRFRHEADFARHILAELGINAIVFADDAGGWHPELLLTRPVRLLVAAEDLAAAREALVDDDDQE
jgi:hypothetical protein